MFTARGVSYELAERARGITTGGIGLIQRLPEEKRWRQKHRQEKQELLRMEFRTFVNAFIKLPCQIVHSGRKPIYRGAGLQARNLAVFFRPCMALRC